LSAASNPGAIPRFAGVLTDGAEDEMRLKKLEKARKGVTTVVVVALAAAFAYTVSGLIVHPQPKFELTVNKTFAITSAIYANYTAGTCTGTTTAKLYPTTTRCLAVTVKNPLSVVIDVKSLSMTVTSFTPTPSNHSLPACTTTMISPPTLFTSPFTITPHTATTIDRPIKLSTTGTQDNCENGTFRFKFTATATYTDTTTTSLAPASPAPIHPGTTLTLTATVTPSNPTNDPYGPATAPVKVADFYSCTTATCATKTLLSTKPLTQKTATTKAATATFTTGALSTGTYYYEAVYPAKGTHTGTFTGSTSNVVTQEVGNTCGTTTGCLKFLTEPARTQTNHHIESGVLSTGTPIIVGVVTATGSLVKSFSGTVTITLMGNPIPPSKLSGTTTLPFVTGEAKFSTLSITHAGSYKLVATASPSVSTSPATSTRFNIDTSVVKCSTHPCSTSGSLGNTVTVKETTTTPTAGYISLGFYGPSKFSCGTPQIKGIYDATAEVLTKTGASTPQKGTTWTLTYTISKTIVKTTGPEGKSKWQICWASTTPFTAVTGPAKPEKLTTIGTTAPTYYVGILRSCSKSVKAPCVESLHSGNAGVEIITVKAAGDSYVRP
jgi:hypothetical protein